MLPRKRSRDERDDGPDQPRQAHQRRLYLIFDDWECGGYTIREINLSRRLDEDLRVDEQLTLPAPYMCLEAPRRLPWLFAALGTRIMALHGFPQGPLPFLDVRSRGVTFGPWKGFQHLPIYFPVGDHDLFALDTFSFRSLSLQPLSLCPPWLENPPRWSWRDLPKPPFSRRDDVTSYALHPDGHTILVGTAAGATFAFDTAAAAEPPMWEERRHGEWTLLPFAGRAHFVRDLDALVGLSNDPASLGHLCAATTDDPAWKEIIGKEKLFSEDPAERHVGATLVYMGGTEFCLVQCVSIGDTDDDAGQRQQQLQLQPHELLDQLQQVLAALDQGRLLEIEGFTASPKRLNNVKPRYIYRLMTFSVCYDSDDGQLTTGESCRLQCYKLPEETSEESFYHDPVAFWL
ncbi:unnamed protein product [Urochloa decumbens]|uniref:DUF1618 domain-containing protein n=1 Tax=Urochloa decumbens TaxID=240449 RepID=A0ABC8W8R8_9POAL